jgi:hypothetical protein
LRFTVRRPPSGEVSPCCHRPSGGDVACSVDVGVAPPGGAGLALEDRLALAVPRCDMPARGATLRRVRGRNLLDPAQSLVLQTRDKLTPPTSKNCAVKATLLRKSSAGFLGGAPRGTGHCPNMEDLDSDHFEATREVSGGRFDPVFPAIPLTGFQLGDGPRVPAMRHQCRFLLRGRQQPEPRHVRTITTDTDNSALARWLFGLGYLPRTQVLGLQPKETS